MRAINIRPARLRRNSTSLTSISNVAAGSYVVAVAASAEHAMDGLKARTTGRPAAPSAVIFIRKARRPLRYSSIQTSLPIDRQYATGKSWARAFGAERRREYHVLDAASRPAEARRTDLGTRILTRKRPCQTVRVARILWSLSCQSGEF